MKNNINMGWKLELVVIKIINIFNITDIYVSLEIIDMYIHQQLSECMIGHFCRYARDFEAPESCVQCSVC